MKKIFKSIGATIGYLAVYLIVSAAVSIAAVIGFAVMTVVEATPAMNPLQIFSAGFDSFLYENSLWIMTISGIITILIYVLIIKLRKKKIRERLDLTPVAFKKLWPVLPLGLTLNLLTSYTIDILPIPESLLADYMESASILDDGSFISMIISVVIMAPLLEEVLMRGLIMRSLQSSMPVALALILQSVIFGLLHGQIIWIGYASVLGLILGVLKLRYQSLYACILLHFAYNASSLIIEPLLYLIQDSMVLNIAAFVFSLAATVFLGAWIARMTRKTIVDNVENTIPVS